MTSNNTPPCVMGAALTKREMFALRAPAAPDWFAEKWSAGNGPTTQASKEAMYFAWRTYYADSLLAELAKGAAS